MMEALADAAGIAHSQDFCTSEESVLPLTPTVTQWTAVQNGTTSPNESRHVVSATTNQGPRAMNGHREAFGTATKGSSPVNGYPEEPYTAVQGSSLVNGNGHREESDAAMQGSSFLVNGHCKASDEIVGFSGAVTTSSGVQAEVGGAVSRACGGADFGRYGHAEGDGKLKDWLWSGPLLPCHYRIRRVLGGGSCGPEAGHFDGGVGLDGREFTGSQEIAALHVAMAEIQHVNGKLEDRRDFSQ